jgi:hypothetical protein
MKIEDFTLNFDEVNIFHNFPNMIKVFLNKELPSAKEYLKGCLSREYLPMLNRFGYYTFEAIMIHVLGRVFHSVRDLSVVRVSTLLDQLNSAVRDQARF